MIVLLKDEKRKLESNCFEIYFKYLNEVYTEKSNIFICDSFFFEKTNQKQIHNRNYFNKIIHNCINKKAGLFIKNIDDHYILYFVTFGTRRFVPRYYTNLYSSASIIILDSINSTNQIESDIQFLKSFIVDVQQKKKEKNKSLKISSLDNIQVHFVKTFNQQNGIDCGIHCCYYIKSILSQTPSKLSQLNKIAMNNSVIGFRNQMLNDINSLL